MMLSLEKRMRPLSCWTKKIYLICFKNCRMFGHMDSHKEREVDEEFVTVLSLVRRLLCFTIQKEKLKDHMWSSTLEWNFMMGKSCHFLFYKNALC